MWVVLPVTVCLRVTLLTTRCMCGYSELCKVRSTIHVPDGCLISCNDNIGKNTSKSTLCRDFTISHLQYVIKFTLDS